MAYNVYNVIHYKENYDEYFIKNENILDNVTNPDKLIRKIYYAVMVLFFCNLAFNILIVIYQIKKQFVA